MWEHYLAMILLRRQFIDLCKDIYLGIAHILQLAIKRLLVRQ